MNVKSNTVETYDWRLGTDAGLRLGAGGDVGAGLRDNVEHYGGGHADRDEYLLDHHIGFCVGLFGKLYAEHSHGLLHGDVDQRDSRHH